MNSIFTVIGKEHLSVARKFFLILAVTKLRFKRFIVNRTNLLDKSTASFLGYKIKVGNYNDFYWTFQEIFIDEDYYFKTETDEPFVVDCGANIGMNIFYTNWIYPGAKFLAFEIEPENIDILKNNLESNGLTARVNLVEKAVGSEEGSMTLYGGRRAGTISKSLIDEQVKKDNSYASNKFEVSVTKLSNYIDKKIDFIKMDIERAESMVIKDLSINKKLNFVNTLTMEYHLFSSDENKLSEIISFMEKDFNYIFPAKFNSLEEIKRTYYNFMIRFGKKQSS